VKHKYSIVLGLLAFATCGVLVPKASANTLQVGPGKKYVAPCAAIAAASAGDTIQIDTAGNYAGDVCRWNTSNLTLIGIGTGRAVINAAGQNSQGKAIWVISGNNTTVENIEFTGAAVADLNGAGIRAEGANLTIRNCYFHDNQEGILTDAGNSTILIEFSEFYHNGAGDGFSHNLYIGNITKFIFRYNYSHGAVVGHLLKSRAAENDIYYNRLSDETSGRASYDIDLPNGGLSYVVGNLVEKGPLAENSALVSYQEEGAARGNPDHQLFVVNNTMVNDFGHGTFVVVDSSVTVPAIIKNNIFQGTGTITTQSSAVKANNFAGNAGLLSPTAYDYHLQAGSPAMDAGADPRTGAGVSLTPVYQYVHPSCAEVRTTTGSGIDIGGYEFNGGNGVPPPNAPSACGAASTHAPGVSFSPTSLSFGSKTVGTTSATQNITLTNTGNALLTISGITVGGTNPPDFRQTNSCGSSLAAGNNCSIAVSFAPSVMEARSATVLVSGNATGSPQSAGLSGAGSF
jgi:Right handed beta helix region